ncbi:RNA-binding cell elongation regulator Jag/EloR [Lachnoclostridium phytofermentans]|uniref:RNA-binding protein KhpB n=1 Tax=Lachnoclostridium phytofermentans (strain ATCC 700394 / DSM 18823 / ISDg) TaxID=357809 RepID=A9KLY0_LACP7|nr:RNA-binding cell elongation regulator Jag/EloR [Lachnoclostridium phytofermentans]ABX44289.1 single-stranded nucleic acid binding R3H domain protein [Lachnoclostridium phytofermentans ISDg]
MEDWKEFTGKTVDEALTEALLSFQTTSEKMEYEVIEKESKGLLGMFSKPAKIRARLKFSIDGVAKNFLDKVFKAMGIDATAEVSYNKDGENVDINIVGDDMGVLIGKRGQTLDSLQYLTSLVINKNNEGYLKVKLDTENYRERRKDTLENLAKNIASKVKRTHKPVSLEPMNPYERRIIHSALQNDKYVETHSEGEEPFRKVVISLKKGVNLHSNNNNNRFGNKDYNKKVFNKDSKKEFQKKYGGNTKDYSTDYKKDYAAYLEAKAAAKEADANKE